MQNPERRLLLQMAKGLGVKGKETFLRSQAVQWIRKRHPEISARMVQGYLAAHSTKAESPNTAGKARHAPPFLSGQ